MSFLLNTIYNENCLDTMSYMPDNFVDLTVTSPPYDNLRAYNGYKFDFEKIAAELYRITKLGGVVVWVVSDATIKGSETGTSFRQALGLMDAGFNLHDTMIFAKNNPIPQNHNRYEQCFEYMFVATKGKPNTFNAIQEPTKNGGAIFDWGNRKTVLDKNQARRHREVDLRITNTMKNKTNIFYYSIGGGKTGHPAVFPEQLAVDHISTWSNLGDIVYDPFTGSGTTPKMAKVLGRNFIGSEISEEYCSIANLRIKGENK
jgi:site-specific DNA-methyltransferase (adenine-specific)